MRIGKAIILSSIAILAIVTSPALAKNSDAQKVDDASASPPCHAYQPAANGSWTELPCQEVGVPSQTPHKSAAKSSDEDPRGRHAVR